MKRKTFFALFIAVFVLMALQLSSCTETKDEGPEPEETGNVLPEKMTIDIPASLSAATSLKSGTATTESGVFDGNVMYYSLRTFVGVGEASAQLLDELITAIRTYDLGHEMDIYYSDEDDNFRAKHLIVKENVSFEGTKYAYKLSVQDSASEGNSDFGIGMQIYWNTSPVVGIAILKPENLNHKNNDMGSALFRIEYSEDSPEYDATMVISIAGREVKAPSIDMYDIDNLKLFVGKKGDILDIYGNSNHPNGYFGDVAPDIIGINYAFVASANDAEDYSVAEIGLPPMTLDIDTRQEILKDYSIENVLIDAIAREHTEITREDIVTYIESNEIMVNTKPAGFFSNGAFVASETAPDAKYELLVTRMDALVQEPTQILIPLDEKDVLHAILVGGDRGCHTCRPTANHNEISFP